MQARAFGRATEILTRNRAALERGARELLQKETLGANELPEVEMAADTRVGG